MASTGRNGSDGSRPSVDGKEKETTKKNSTMDWMELNSDKTVKQLIKTSDVDWVGASQASGGGVFRKMIERKGDEVARATTIVKFLPNQSFPRHTHAGGEEFMVLDGVWRDDYGAFGKYSYIRNYIGSGHTPSIGSEGCVILVKLRQMSYLSTNEPEHKHWINLQPSEVWKNGERYSTEFTTTTTTSDNKEGATDANTAVVPRKLTLFQNDLETTAVHVWPNHCKFSVKVPKDGMELFVVDGSFTSTTMGTHNKWSWCRLPSNEEVLFEVQTQEEDVYIWSKEGHLNSDEVSVSR